MAKKPEQRYSDCLELRDDLLALLSSGAVAKEAQDLKGCMGDLFEKQMQDEKRVLYEQPDLDPNQMRQSFLDR